MSKIDELWDRFSFYFSLNSNGLPLMMQGAFRAALEEYGEHVKEAAVKVCHAVEATKWNMSLSGKPTTLRCADAIKDMELK